VEIDKAMASLWSKVKPSSPIGRIIYFVLSGEALLYILLAVVSPQAPVAASGQVVPLPGRYHSFYVGHATALIVGMVFAQFVVTLMVLVPLAMAARADEPDETPSARSNDEPV
jgi:heme/copper-type cytochrome/quinol oxidase subunit 1